MDKKQIEATCEEMLKTYNYNEGEVDIIAIAQKMGFKVGISMLSSNEDGFIVVDKNKDKIKEMLGIDSDMVIGVNAKRDLKTKRFILAHEVAHYKLHYKDEIGMYAHRENRKGKNKEENAADYFAACLLMPADVFQKKYKELKGKKLADNEVVTLLEAHFNVPRDSVKRRIGEVIGAS